MQFHAKRYCATACLALAGLLVAAGFTAQEACAKGPQPKPNFVIETGVIYFVATGAIDETGLFSERDSWIDEDGVTWIRYRFHDADSQTYYFEAVLPLWPDNGVGHDFELTAGPNGYLSDGVLYEGVWAVGTAKARTQTRWVWEYDDWAQKWYKYVRHDYLEWTLKGFLLP